jgi:hypothetical protein
MRRRSTIKVIAFVLVLVFSQRLGLTLWMHHLYHEGPRAQALKAQKSGLPQWEVHCDCFEDAFMPMDQAYTFVYHAPMVGYLVLETVYKPATVYMVTLYSNLRGPPSPFFTPFSYSSARISNTALIQVIINTG